MLPNRKHLCVLILYHPNNSPLSKSQEKDEGVADLQQPPVLKSGVWIQTRELAACHVMDNIKKWSQPSLRVWSMSPASSCYMSLWTNTAG